MRGQLIITILRILTLHPDKIKSRTLTSIDDKQKSFLKQSFAHESNPKIDIRQKLSEQLGLSEPTVYNWFRAERERIRKSKRPLSPKSEFI